jgi:microcystin-dependent protein
MAQPYVGEIRLFAGNFAPAGWMLCEGQLLPISEYETLFNLIGTTYGGDGQTTFALPDMRGRLPIHMGSTYTLAETGGVETVTITSAQIPAHNHVVVASTAVATQTSPQNNLLAQPAGLSMYRQDNPNGTDMLNPATISSTGGSQPHDNFQPYLCMNYIISLFGIFPTQT